MYHYKSCLGPQLIIVGAGLEIKNMGCQSISENVCTCLIKMNKVPFKVLAITWASITKDNTIAMLTPVTYVCVNLRDIVNDDRISSSRGDEAESDGRLRADVFKCTNKTHRYRHTG